LEEHGTACKVTFSDRSELAPGETCEGLVQLPLGEESLPRAPVAGELLLIGKIQSAPVLHAIVLSCVRK
ncbi:MAG TPA: hypothetical protein VM820_12935, partial [Vicinamibacterales bacterium]|nr:hypothetical protein [Vicinamibacterales bacterium]